jgi:23S rRNA (adenine2503-C2)-methyltransferase
MPVYLKNYTSSQLHSIIPELNNSSRISNQIQSYIFRYNDFPNNLPGISPAFLNRLSNNIVVPHLGIIDKKESPTDHFTKYLFSSEDSLFFEAVRIPVFNKPKKSYVICVSSQIGCAMGCSFCETGKMGFIRNLSAWEIIDQFIIIRNDSHYPINNIVFMGMGEPFDNYDQVINACRILSESCVSAISAKSITISTVGINPGLDKFIETEKSIRLIYSLSSAISDKRASIIPIERKYPFSEITSLLRKYHLISRKRITLAWTMISGFNTGEDEALALSSIMQGIPIKIDLIDVNDPSEQFRPPSDRERNNFIDYLRKHVGMPVARRYSGGQDIHAGCGMLSLRFTKSLYNNEIKQTTLT